MEAVNFFEKSVTTYDTRRSNDSEYRNTSVITDTLTPRLPD